MTSLRKLASVFAIAIVAFPFSEADLPCIGVNRNKTMGEFIKDNLDFSDFLRAHKEKGKFFKKIVLDENHFPCKKLARSLSKPTSIDKLRPGDIDIIAAVGDSLTAASGARASNILGISNAYKGLTFSIGGYFAQERGAEAKSSIYNNVSTHFTIANALKFYNPNLKGFSAGISSGEDWNSGFNMAVPGAKAIHLRAQVRKLVRELKKSTDFDNDWKLVTFFIGGNNLCQTCVDPNSSASNFEKDVKYSLDYLHQHLPRAFVNLITIFDISFLKSMSKGHPICDLAHTCFCSCALESPRKVRRISKNYVEVLTNLVETGRYDTRDDFKVVIQPFLEDIEPPQVDGKPDLTYFAPDCFHFSQRGHNSAGRYLWNNMFELKKSRPNTFDPNMPIKCPTEEMPYLVA
ncbi:phospholipase B1, membrane-associated-like [Symsagittifera roscoffensis]|uniref:phospholipase B1, membrane-associated-like n=1 Tax=Symsagittifera roscoffensis TaxID=84072 RepID=UPI00307BBABE